HVAPGTAAELLRHVSDAAAAGAQPLFLSRQDQSGSHAAEVALWRKLGLTPAAPWYQRADDRLGLVAQARARAAYAVVERGVWVAQGGAPLGALVAADPLLTVPVHAMRSFRINHPAGKFLVAWLGGAKGRAVVERQRAYAAPPG
ncbi:MAG: hypothetical protein ABIQ60_12415, partial [Burkholderiaceae bacterium]